MQHSVISRDDAAAQKLTHFFTGKPCKYGHVAPRFVSTGGCAECNSERAARFRKDAPARFSYDLHPDDVAAALAYCQALDIQRGRVPAASASLMVGKHRVGMITPEGIEAARLHAFPALRGGQ